MSRQAHRPFSVCVYCSSSAAAPVDLLEAAAEFGTILARDGARMVYGGGGLGMMGACARAAHDAGGEVVGVIPRFLTELELAYSEARTEVVETMHERKARMFEESDAFAILPGAIGTLEEVVELLSWRRLGLHAKPIVFFNPDGFWNRLFELFDQFAAQSLLPAEFRDSWSEVDRIEDLLPALRSAPRTTTEYVPIIQRM